MRGVTLLTQALESSKEISTHTPHARRDLPRSALPYLPVISTHTPHARRDGALLGLGKAQSFQLTRLMRGVTYSRLGINFCIPNFNSHASCEA